MTACGSPASDVEVLVRATLAKAPPSLAADPVLADELRAFFSTQSAIEACAARVLGLPATNGPVTSPEP